MCYIAGLDIGQVFRHLLFESLIDATFVTLRLEATVDIWLFGSVGRRELLSTEEESNPVRVLEAVVLDLLRMP